MVAGRKALIMWAVTADSVPRVNPEPPAFAYQFDYSEVVAENSALTKKKGSYDGQDPP